MKNLERLFNPKSVAVVGASIKEGSVGYDLLKNLVKSDFKGNIYPINPNRPEILGVKAYPSISAVPEKVDLAIIATPAAVVPAVVEECCERDVGGLVIITAGFKEAGEQGMILWKQLSDVVSRHNVPVIGPNCLGFLRPSTSLNASFASKITKPGKIAFISQSGALGTAMLDWAIENDIGFSYFVSIGSMIDVGFNELIDHFGDDDGTDSIILYMESLANAKEFIEVSKRVMKKKPIIALKVGRTEQGASAAKSHTGSLAGNDAVFDAAFRRAGVIRINTIAELLDFAEFSDKQSTHVGKNIMIVTNAGGPGVIAADMMVDTKGTFAKLSDDTMKKLSAILPAYWSHSNPIDILGDAPPERYRQALEICFADPNIDAILVILTPQTMTNPEGVADAIAKLDRKGKTIVTSFIGGHDVMGARHKLELANIPSYETPEEALRCLITLSLYSQRKDEGGEKCTDLGFSNVNNSEPGKIIASVRAEGRNTLIEEEAKRLLAFYGIPSAKNGMAKSSEEASSIAQQIGFPVVMKIASPDILHKTDVGGVKLGITTQADAAKAYDSIIESAKKKMPNANIHGVLVEQQITKNYELLVGSKKDPIFGHILMFGMGGTAVELYNDTVIELLPIDAGYAKRMINATKIGQLMSGYRGTKAVNVALIQETLCRVSMLISDFPEIREIDINPLAVDESTGQTRLFALDVKIILDKN